MVESDYESAEDVLCWSAPTGRKTQRMGRDKRLYLGSYFHLDEGLEGILNV